MKILIIKHGSLGDLVLSFGAIKTLNHHYANQTNHKMVDLELYNLKYTIIALVSPEIFNQFRIIYF